MTSVLTLIGFYKMDAMKNIVRQLFTIGITLWCSLQCTAVFATGCNDINANHIEIEKHPTQTFIDAEKSRVFSLLNYLSEMECRYRKVGSNSWIIPPDDCHKANVPGAASLLDCEFRLETEAGGVDYEYEIRVKCTLDGWGNWYRGTFHSYCGPDGLDTDPYDKRPNELEYRDEVAEEGRLSLDEGQSFFIVDEYLNNKLIFQNLDPNTLYWFKCRTRCDYNSEWAGFTPLKSVRTPCNEPSVSSLITYGADMGTHIGIRCERNASHYEFNMRKKGNSQWRTSGSISSDSYTFPENVNKGDLYEFRCRLECGGEWTNYSSIVEGMIPVDCPQPIAGEVGVNQITNKTAHFYCRSGHGGNVVEKHIFRYRTENGSDWKEKRSENNEVDISKLEDFTNYIMQVQHECTNGVTGNWSGQVFFTTEESCTVKKKDIQCLSLTYSSVDLFCEQEGREGYHWEVKRLRDGRKINIPNPVMENPYNLSSLDQGEEYSVRLKVDCETNTSEWTEEKTFTTSLCLPPDAADLQITNITNHDAAFVYNGNTQSGLEWQYRQIGNANWRKVVSTQNETMLDSLVGNADYECRLRIKCSEFPLTYSAYSSVVQFSTRCDAYIIRFSGITTTNVTVHASDVGTNQYQFRLRPEGGNWVERSANTHEYSFTNLTSGTDYEFQVKALCGGMENWSPSAFASTDEIITPPCSAPHRGQLSKGNINSRTAELICNKGNVDQYIFRYSSGSGWTESSPMQEGYYIAAGLSPSTIYVFQCRVVCNNVQSEWSDSIFFRTTTENFTLSTRCPAPYLKELLSFNIGSTSSILLCRTEASQYRFRYKDSSATDWIELPEQNINRQALSNLKPNTVYAYQCSVDCNNGFGAFSENRYFQTQSETECLPHSSDNFAAVIIGPQEATLISSNQARLFRFRYKPIGGNEWIYSDTSSTPAIKIQRLTPNTWYLYQVQSLCQNFLLSEFSRSKYFKTSALCTIDTSSDIQINHLNDTSVQFHVNLKAFNGLWIRYRAVGNNTWDSLWTFHAGPLNPSLVLQRQTLYEWQALLYCSDNRQSQWSESQHFKTGQATASKDHHLKVLKVFPNPGDGLITVESPAPATIGFFHFTGIKVFETTLNQSVQIIDVRHLPPGVYMLTIRSESGNTVNKYYKIQ